MALRWGPGVLVFLAQNCRTRLGPELLPALPNSEVMVYRVLFAPFQCVLVGPHCAALTGLALRDPSAAASQGLGLKACTHLAGLDTHVSWDGEAVVSAGGEVLRV